MSSTSGTASTTTSYSPSWDSEAIPHFIEQHWQLLLAILTGPIGLAVDFIKNHFDGIVSFFTGLPKRLENAGKDMFSWIGGLFRQAIDEVISLWNDLHFSLPHISVFGHHFGGETIGVPKIPLLANGGIVSSPTLAMIGEAGPEAVVPLSHGGYGGGGEVTVHTVVVLDGRKVGEAVTPHVRTKLPQTCSSRAFTGLA